MTLINRIVARGAAFRTAYSPAVASVLAAGRLPFQSTPLSSVSLVTVGRNDDYMDDLEERLHASLEWNLKWFASTAIFVEWNPPPDRPLLSPGLARIFPQLTAYVVGHELHRRSCGNDNIALMEYHAKNVGLRRATSDWALCTNSDVAIGIDSAVRARRGLNPEFFYTATRVDIPFTTDLSIATLVRPGRQLRVIPYSSFGTGDFALASRAAWHEIRGYDEQLTRSRIGCDVRGTEQMTLAGFRSCRIGHVYHFDHDSSCTNGPRPNHGERPPDLMQPYQNTADWGLSRANATLIAERVWQLD